MLSAKKQMADGKRTSGEVQGSRPLSNYNFDEAVLKVQEWNEALRCESAAFSTCNLTEFLSTQLPHDLLNITGESS